MTNRYTEALAVKEEPAWQIGGFKKVDDVTDTEEKILLLVYFFFLDVIPT